jgi:DNA-binding SARP family transcriptional activator
VHQLKTFGTLAVEGDTGSSDTGHGRRRSLALLAMCAVWGRNGVPREQVFNLLWPESDNERASSSLRQVLFGLRRTLGEDSIVNDSAAICINPARIEADVVAFNAAHDAGQHLVVAEHYRGPFLGGFHLRGLAEFEHWAETCRDRFHRNALRALETLATEASNEHRHADAIMWWRRAVALDQVSSRYALGLLNALVASGDRTGALDFARVHELVVRKELDTEPDSSIVERVAGLRKSRTPAGHDVQRAARISPLWVPAVHSESAPPQAAALLMLVNTPSGSVSGLAHRLLCNAAIAEGRWSAACESIETALGVDAGPSVLQLALISTFPFMPVSTDQLKATRRRLSEWKPNPSAAGGTEHDETWTLVRLHLLGLLCKRIGDARGGAKTLSDLRGGNWSVRGERLAHTIESSIRAHQSWPDNSGASLRLLEMADWEYSAAWLPTEVGDRYFRGVILVRLGRDGEAREWFTRIAERAVYELPFLAPAERRLALLEARAGHAQKSREHHARAAALWSKADREVLELAEREEAHVM